MVGPPLAAGRGQPAGPPGHDAGPAGAPPGPGGRGIGRTLPAWLSQAPAGGAAPAGTAAPGPGPASAPAPAPPPPAAGRGGWKKYWDPTMCREWWWHESEQRAWVDWAPSHPASGAGSAAGAPPGAVHPVTDWMTAKGWEAYLDPETERIWWWHPETQTIHFPKTQSAEEGGGAKAPGAAQEALPGRGYPADTTRAPEVPPPPPAPAPAPAAHHRDAARAGARPANAGVQSLVATEAQSSAVQRSWERVQHLGSYALGEKLYKHVFKVAPQTMELFPPEVRHKYRDWSAEEGGEEEGDLLDSPALRKLFGKVINAVGVSVAGLRQPSQMVPMLTQLGARHIGYSVEESYWKVLGEGLILTLKECLGEDFTPEVELAWTLVYGFMSAVMIEGLRGAIAARNAARHSDDRSSLVSGHSVRLGSAASEEPLQHRMWSNSQAFTHSDAEDFVVKTSSISMRSMTNSDYDDLGAKTPSITGSLVEGDAPH